MTAKIIYNGDLRTTNIHQRSQSEIITDAPVDNAGKGQAFSPTDLVAAALGNCMLTVMGIRAQKLGVNIDGASADVTKIMTSDPRRIAEIKIYLVLSGAQISPSNRKVLEKVAKTCPVALSIHSDIIQTIHFDWK